MPRLSTSNRFAIVVLDPSVQLDVEMEPECFYSAAQQHLRLYMLELEAAAAIWLD